MSDHHKINYIEFPARNMYKTKRFFAEVFDWKFQDYGPEYCAFFESGMDGGFFKSEQHSDMDNGSVLVVLYSEDLDQSQKSIEVAGGSIKKAIFDFPGGKRFHFCDPNGNEFAVWSDK